MYHSTTTYAKGGDRMSDKRFLLLLLSLFMGLSYNAFTVFLWWIAAQNDWQMRLIFNRFHEHWIEGVFFHATILLPVITVILLVRQQRRERRREKKDP